MDAYSGSEEDNYTNYLMVQILADYDDDPTGSVQAAAEEMNEMTDYVEEFNDDWFKEEGANITVQSWADTWVKISFEPKCQCFFNSS